MEVKFGEELHWAPMTRRIAFTSGLIGLILAALAMYMGGTTIIAFWQIALPILMAGLCFGLSGFLINYWQKWHWLKTLPGIDYPFDSVARFFGLHVFLFVYVLLAYFLGLLAPDSWLLKILSTPVAIIIFLVGLFVVSAAGGQLIVNEQEKGLVYRDTVSSGRFSRQDLLFSHAGSWEDGIIFGWKLFPYAGMTNLEREKKALKIYGKEEDGLSYVFVLYTPRNIKWAESALQGRLD